MPSFRPLECTYAAVPEMPSGNLVKSGRRLPLESRVDCIQQSSMFTYWYPAAASPEDTILSAVCLIRASDTLHLYAFQSFQPIGGVRASPLASAFADPAEGPATSAAAAPATSSGAAAAASARRRGCER